MAAALAPRVAVTQAQERPPGTARGGRVARVATLWTTSRQAAESYLAGIEEGLAEHGWIAGRNLRLEHRFTEGVAERLPALAAEVVHWNPDVAVAPLNTGALALQRLSTTLPIVFVISFDPVGAGLAASLGRPGRNATGLTGASPDVTAKRLQLLSETAPGLRRLGVIWNSGFPGLRPFRRSIDDAARKLGLAMVDAGVRDAEAFAAVLQELARERVDGIYVIGDNLTFLRRREIADAARRHRWPSAFSARESCDDGGLLCYGVDQRAHFKRSAVFVDKILRGGNPATIPIEQPNTYALVLNLRTARALGIEIPRSMLLRADAVIE